MKFGMTLEDRNRQWEQRLVEYNREGAKSETIFALLPKKCESGIVVWMEDVTRLKKYCYSGDYYYYVYNEIKEKQ